MRYLFFDYAGSVVFYDEFTFSVFVVFDFDMDFWWYDDFFASIKCVVDAFFNAGYECSGGVAESEDVFISFEEFCN